MKLQELRNKIDQIDTELLDLLNQRTRLVQEVGSVKKVSGDPVFDPGREQALLLNLEKKNPGPISNSCLRAVFREILSASRAHQKQLCISYLGPGGTFSHQAAIERFGHSDEFLPAPSIPEIFATVSRGEADAGIVPIENSTEGGVSATLDCLLHTDLHICGESYLKIQNALATSSKTEGEPTVIYSHPQPLGQCRQWLFNHYPNVPQVEVSSTSEGARRALDEPGTAAICNAFAANRYDLRLLASSINDVPGNTTRFLIIAPTEAKPSKHDKTSLLFSVNHEKGVLSQILSILASNGLNLLKIESRPAPHKEWEYIFFLDVAGHRQQAPFAKALEKVKKKTLWMKILGSYPEAQGHA